MYDKHNIGSLAQDYINSITNTLQYCTTPSIYSYFAWVRAYVRVEESPVGDFSVKHVSEMYFESRVCHECGVS